MAKEKPTIYADIPRDIVENDEVKTDVISAKDQERLVHQVDTEYLLSFAFNEAKRKLSLARLKLYNNQRRDVDAVGDPLMFTVFTWPVMLLNRASSGREASTSTYLSV